MVEGRHLLHPDVTWLVDVRVWIDVDENRANDNEFRRELDRRRARGDTSPLGRWTAGRGAPAPPPTTARQRIFTRFRPDRSADALFAPVGPMRPPATLRFMDEIGTDFALWEPGNDLLGELEELLPMPEELRGRLKDWCTRIDTPGAVDGAFADEGRQLSAELQHALGPAWRFRDLTTASPTPDPR